MLSPLEETNKLVEKVKHLHRTNTDMSVTALARRLNMDPRFIKDVIAGKKVYPRYYKQIASRFKMPIEEVVERMEQKQHWCVYCQEWRHRDEFYENAYGGWRHRSQKCVGKKGSKAK